MRSRVSSLLLVAALAVRPAAASPSATGASKNVRATLAPAVASIQPGQPFWVGLRLQMNPRWHTYWKNPGDSGLPTRIRWTLPEGFAAGEIQWPQPQRFLADPLMSYGYAGEVWLLAEIRPPARITAAAVPIAAKADWLECHDICIPGKAELAFTLPVRDVTPPQGEHAAAIATARARVPAAPRFEASAIAAGSALRLRVSGAPRPREAYFYPAAGGVIEHALPQRLETSGAAFWLALPRAANGALPASLDGVLELDGQAFEVKAPRSKNNEGGSDR